MKNFFLVFFRSYFHFFSGSRIFPAFGTAYAKWIFDALWSGAFIVPILLCDSEGIEIFELVLNEFFYEHINRMLLTEICMKILLIFNEYMFRMLLTEIYVNSTTFWIRTPNGILPAKWNEIRRKLRKNWKTFELVTRFRK